MDRNFLPDLKYVFTNPFFILRRYLYIQIQSMAAGMTGGRMLDIGCGTKPYRELFDVKEYVGLDFRKDGKNQNPDADFLYDGGKFPFRNNQFELALATEVLEHVFEPDFFISEINRVLKIDGLCLFTVPFIWDEHEQPYDFARYTSYGIRALLERHGFVILRQVKTGNYITTLGQLFCTYLFHLVSKRRTIYKLSRPMIFAPIQLFTLLMSAILPANTGFYLNNIVLCKKIK